MHFRQPILYIFIVKKGGAMGVPLKKQTYPYIDFNPEIAEGKPVIEGTRITVRTIAGYYQMGMTVDEILNTIPHLTSSQIHSALAYYFDHQVEIDADLTDSSDEKYWKTQIVPHPNQIKIP
jgi:uncharacterized protein (DUF433 family)